MLSLSDLDLRQSGDDLSQIPTRLSKSAVGVCTLRLVAQEGGVIDGPQDPVVLEGSAHLRQISIHPLNNAVATLHEAKTTPLNLESFGFGVVTSPDPAVVGDEVYVGVANGVRDPGDGATDGEVGAVPLEGGEVEEGRRGVRAE